MTDDAQDVDRDPGNGARSSVSPGGSQPPLEGTPVAPVAPVPGAHTGNRHALPVWQEMGLLLVMALVLAVVIKSFFLQAFYIPSGSMNDTLVLDDRILVQKVSYWTGDPQRGDIVVFSDPGGWLGPAETGTADSPLTRTMETVGLYPTGGHLVKRVIGVGGDRVVCCDTDGRITVNRVALHEESYLPDGEQPSIERFDIEVPDGYLWVQGDNRSNSADSRKHLGDPGGGMIPVDDVVGKVFMVVWPWDHLTMIERPATFDAVGGTS